MEYKVVFYEDKNGRMPVLDYINELKSQNTKDSRIKVTKITDYIQILRTYGTRAGEPYMKHLDDGIWELRPLRDRILFFGWNGNTFVLLHHFMKSTQKTPRREIEKAIAEMKDFMEVEENE